MIVDDQRLFAEAIEVTLREMGEQVVGVATTGEGALASVREHRPELVLLDIGLPDRSGIDVGRRILEERPDTKIIALSALEDPNTVKEALGAGFRGFLTKDLRADRLGTAIRGVLDGGDPVPQKPAKKSIGARSRADSGAELLITQLTPRETQVLEMLTDGASSEQIAVALEISPDTVRTHVHGILSKLQVHTRLEAVMFAVRHGLVRVRR